MYKNLIITVVLACITAGTAMAATGGSTTCYNCDNFHGPWTCDTFGSSGGTTCTLGQDSCTVSGNCSGSSSGLVAVSAQTVRQIALAHPRVAATVFELTKTGRLARTATVYWNADKMTAQQVDNLIVGGSAGSKQTPGEAVVYDSRVETTARGSVLVIVPQGDFPADPVFTEFRLELTSSNGTLVPTSFSIR